MAQPTEVENRGAKNLRIGVSALCGIAGVALLVGDYTGMLSKNVSWQVYTFLISVGLLGPEATFEKAAVLIEAIWPKR